MSTNSAYFGHLTSDETREAAESNALLVLPLGAIEQHGPHLPVDTDDYLATRAAKEAVELARDQYGTNIFYLPPVHFGNSFAHLAYPGRISLGFETFTLVIFDILDELIRSGFRNFIVLNGNGGNEVCISIAIRKITEKWFLSGESVKIYKFGAGGISSPPMPGGFAEKINNMTPGNQKEIHAGARETSYYLSNQEEFVRKDQIAKPVMQEVGWVNFTVDEISNSGSTGDPSQASKEIGQLFWETVIPTYAKKFDEISRATG